MASTPEISVAIILVNWNGLEYTEACLESLRQVDYPNFKVVVVDNASANPEGKQLKTSFPEIELIQNSQNLGFAGGNNVGICWALEQGFSHVCLLNNDTQVAPDFLGEMVLRFRQGKSLGVVQPMILFLHQPKKIWSAGGKWNPKLGRAVTLGDREPLVNYRVKSPQIDWATGCCMMVSREALLKSGLLNEQYFIYFEDVEWSLRIKKQGFSLELAPKAVIYHEAGAASKKSHIEGVLSPKVFYYHVRNQILLLRKYKAYMGFGYHLARFFFWMLYFLGRRRFKKLKAVVKGIRDGFREKLQAPPAWP
ncbi:glycosyltransferase family 2 protein [Algoriphagus mannitolivorans]|uniref:glycosyltransferase family 2 protein n=1 Tax=Algoriphagus mannitolivorans TaxID=226504 RepID=UPI00041A05DF|nr:glycosyltransferase family 2 protein [Algoriphagus mannitolivorans]